MTDVRLLLAKNIKRGRDTLGISQMGLAERVGCSASYLGDVETGRAFPSAEMFGKIAEALSFRPFQLLLEDPAELDQASRLVQIQLDLETKIAGVVREATVQYQALLTPKG